MKKAYVLVLGILAVFLVSACNSNVDIGGVSDSFIGGSTGLVIDFEDGSPPDEVTDEEFAFQAIIRLENQGEWRVGVDEINVDLDGFLAADFGGANTENGVIEEDLLATRRDSNGNIIDGTTVFVTFPDEDGDFQVPENKFKGNVEFPFRADVCYMYGTKAQARICVLKDLTDPTDNALCDPNSQTDIDSSSSPIQIQNYKQSIAGKNKIQFTFDVVHAGNGNVYNPEVSVDCPNTAKEIRKQMDEVLVSVEAPEGVGDLRCSGLDGDNSDVIKLSRGKRSVTCTLDTGNPTQDFESIVSIEARFTYNDFKQTQVLVKHLIDDEDEN